MQLSQLFRQKKAKKSETTVFSGTHSLFTDLIKLSQSNDKQALSFKKNSQHPLSGPHLSTIRGRGMNFEEVRHYQNGDDVRAIDWRVTARTGTVHTKVFREEHERPFHFIVDHSASMQFGTRVCFKSVMADRCCAVLAGLAFAHGHRIGGVIAHHKPVWLKAQASKKGLFNLFHQLTNNQQTTTAHSLEEALKQFSRHSRGGEVVVIMSDFFIWSQTLRQLLQQLARRYDLFCLHILDPLELNLNQHGDYCFTDQAQQDRTYISIHSAQDSLNYQQHMQAQLQGKQQFFRKYGLFYQPVLTDQDPKSVRKHILQRSSLFRTQL